MIKTIEAKLGNMRKTARFVLYPQRSGSLGEVIIQSDRRIARVNLETGRAMLSAGKGGHYCNTFLHLSPALGAVEVEVPASVLEELRRLTATNTKDDGIDQVRLIG